VYTSIKGRERLLVAKLDVLYNYVKCKKAKANIHGMEEGIIYYCKNYVHYNYETLELFVK